MPENVRLQKLRNFAVKICDSEAATVGTGVVVSADGKIITCAHVAKAALGVHPREAMGQEIIVYFPQISEAERQSRIAVVAGCFHEYDDDVVLLKLKDGSTPLGPEQIAQLGDADGSEGNEFQSYGFSRIGKYESRYASGEIQGPVNVDLPEGETLISNPIQLKTEDIRSGLSGGPVLDKKRNLIIGLVTERWNPQGKSEEDNIAWATDNYVLTFDPIGLPLLRESLPLGQAPQPKVDLETTKKATVPKQKYSWNNAPQPIEEWVGRADLLKAISDDWIDPKKRITGLIGFGGEGKSVLARRWIENLLEDKASPQPNGIFWWGFYERPSVDEFFEAALNYLSGDNADLTRLCPSSSAKVHFLSGMLHGGRYLFVLDSLEVLQHQEGDRFGLLKSNNMREFLQFFAALGHDSFCLVTSRVPLADMMEFTSYQHRDVDRLSAADGRLLLQKLGVMGADLELDKVVANWDGHALILSLIGSYLADKYGGDISQIKDLPGPTRNQPRYKRVHNVLSRYEETFSNEEQEFLKLFSAFRISIGLNEFNKVFRIKSKKRPDKPAALSKSLASLDDAAFEEMIKRLVNYRILRLDILLGKYSAHPLIKSHYYELLMLGDHSQAVEVHRRIKEYYLAKPDDLPSNPTLDDLKPFIEAVHHACQSGDYDDAINYKILYIDKGKNNYYLGNKLGANETDLAILLEFFYDGDSSQDPMVSDQSEKGLIHNDIGCCLMNLGQLNQAERFLKRAISIYTNITKDWLKASRTYQNLSELYAHLGALEYSSDVARQALECSIRGGDKIIEVSSVVSLAFAEHLRGNFKTASKDFKKAEALGTAISKMRYLYGLDGIQHAEHLMRIRKLAYARNVTKDNLKICEINNLPIDLSRCHRVLGDLYTYAGKYDAALKHYNDALKKARDISHRTVLIEALLARGRYAAKHVRCANEAFSDLEEAFSYATMGDYHIYETDIRVALSWAHIAAGDKEKAKAEATHARQMSNEMGYYWGKKDAEEVLAKIEESMGKMSAGYDRKSSPSEAS
jgi:tetratricopeptide (TPR) repeat protein